MDSRRSLPVLLLLACSSGGARDGTATGLSVGETTGDPATGATAWVTETDGMTSTTGNTTAMTVTTDPDPTTGVDPDGSTGDGSTGGGPVSCAEDASGCNAWFLPRGASQWEAVTIGGPAALGPSGPVLAAFDIEAERIAFVVTAEELIRVDLEARTWVSKTDFGDRFPEVNVPVRSAYSVPAYWGGGMGNPPEGVTIAGTDVAFLYEYDVATDTFVFDQGTVFGGEWSEPGAPTLNEVREMWIDVTNDEGWADHDVSEICQNGDGAVGPYIGVVTADQIQVLEAGYCFAFFEPDDYEDFAPTGLPGAPPVERVGGVAYNETTGLVVFASD